MMKGHSVMQSIGLFRKKMNWAEHWTRVYRILFRSPHGQRALTDLADFCYANETTYSADEKRFYMNEGRREVWLHVMELTQLSPEELIAIYDHRGFPATEEPTEGDNHE